MTGRPKILIIEDDTSVAMMATFLLTRAGCDVVIADTGSRGLQLAGESRFDLITLDRVLPDANGFDICRKLKERHISRKTPLIFVSGQSCEEDKKCGLELGAVDYITKPFDASDFVRRILVHANVKTEPNGIIQPATE